MTNKRTPQQRARRHARAAAAAAARRRKQRLRIAVPVALGVAGLAAVLLVVFLGGDDDAEEAGSTSTSAAEGSGPPCVAPTGELPAGAPSVPVQEGPPPTELVTEDLKEGTGAEVTEGATVTVHYIGVACSTGTIFDSSYQRNEPATFGLTQVIPGWTTGIPGMNVGGQRLLGIPPDLAYGPQGQPPTIGPNETLWFVVEVLETQPA